MWAAVFAVGVLSAGVCAGTTDETPDAEPESTVVVSDGQVDISASETPVSELLARLADEAGFEVLGQVADPRAVSVEFEGVPLRRAVRRLLAGQNFTMRYGADGELRRITLRSPPVERSREGRTAAARRSAQGRRASRITFQTALQRHPPIRVTGALARQVGRSEVPVTRLLAVVRAQPAGPLLTQAMTRFLQVVERDQTLRQAWRDMSPAQIHQFLRQYGGGNADQFARFVAAKAADANVRQAAAAALRSLPAGRG